MAPHLDPFDDLERNGEANCLTMVPVGPVAQSFVNDTAFIKTIMGPFGSAKTTTSFQAIIAYAMAQPVAPDGVRYSRGCITRPTYGQLQDTVMKDWFEWFPKTRENWNGDRMEHTLLLDVPGISKLQIQVLFRACEDRKKAEQIFKGMQLTWLWPNEIDTQHPAVVEYGLPRLGRYPPKSKGGCTRYGMIADMNAPDIDNWTYDLLVNGDMKMSPEAIAAMRAELGEDFRIGFHRQPSGVSPDAENLMNLPTGYYERLQVGKSENWIRRFVHNEFGAVRNGQPVYPEFNDDFHTAKTRLKPVAGLPVCFSLDGGSTPALLFGQQNPDGSVRVLDEIVVMAPDDDSTLEKLGPESFGKMAAIFWRNNFAECEFGGAWGDPRMFDGEEYQRSWAQLFMAAFVKELGYVARGWKLRPAPCNDNRLPARLEAVRRKLTESPGGKPGLILSNACRFLRRGFNNGYVIVRQQMSNGQGIWKDVPLKNDFSHVHDALQYLLLGFSKHGTHALARSAQRRASRQKQGARVNFGNGTFRHVERAR